MLIVVAGDNTCHGGKGPFVLLEGTDYLSARKLANSTNKAIHKANPELKGLQIHENQPVKFGGSPTEMSNKVFITRDEHIKYTVWWNKMQNTIKDVK